MYEGGIRVPLIAWAPGKVEAGTCSDHISAFWDVMPTLADIAGGEIKVSVTVYLLLLHYLAGQAKNNMNICIGNFMKEADALLYEWEIGKELN